MNIDILISMSFVILLYAFNISVIVSNPYNLQFDVSEVRLLLRL